MPSPVGHALAGFTIGLIAQPAPNGDRPRRLLTPFTVVGAVAAALPDADLLVRHMHRGWTHSIGATVLVFIVAAIVTGKVNPRMAWRLACVLAAAHASHIVMDWMGTDPFPPGGVQALWPFGRGYYMSGWDFFPPTERDFANPRLWLIDGKALAFETVVMGGVAALAIRLTRTRRSRAPISVRDNPRPPSA